MNPVNPLNIVAVWQQDRWSNGGSRGNVVGTSFNGGSTWTIVTATKSSLCTAGSIANGGDLPRATDPWLSFAPNGDVYLSSLALKTEIISQKGDDRGVANTVLVAKSVDGGLTWSDPATLIRGDCQIVNDKQSITADPNGGGRAYAVWTRFGFPNANANASCMGALNAEISADVAAAASFSGPGWFSRTTDGGASWAPAREIFPVGQGTETINHQIVVLPSSGPSGGDLVDFFELSHVRDNAHKERGDYVAFIRSGDRGLSWSSEAVAAAVDAVATRDPLTGQRVRAFINMDSAVDPRSGALYAVWEDGRFSGDAYGDIALTMSIDGGMAWSAPIRVNRTPATPETGNRQAFLPSVAVADDGSVAVSYYDFRFNGNDASAVNPSRRTASWCVARRSLPPKVMDASVTGSRRG